jgi:hypothetical protein
LEALKADLTERQAEADARRAYEYDARKRLYEVYEPLRMRLLDCTDGAIRQLVDVLARPTRGGTTDSSPEYRSKTTVFYLLAPLAAARKVERRLTLVDLALSQSIHAEFVLAQAIYRSLADDGFVARIAPEINYSPYVRGWREKRQQDPSRYRRQGLPLGRLDTALDVLHVTRPEGVDTIMSFGEFEPVLDNVPDDDVRSGPGAARDLFDDFDPATRPILWRLLMCQALMYWCFQECVFGSPLLAPHEAVKAFVRSDAYSQIREAFASFGTGDPEGLEITTAVAGVYMADRVGPALRRAERLAASTA